MKNMVLIIITSAAQMYCLAKFLPLLIGTLVPEENEHWKLFCLLLEIVDIVFAHITSINAIAVLEGLIEEHHSTFLRIYPNRSLYGSFTFPHDEASTFDPENMKYYIYN